MSAALPFISLSEPSLHGKEQEYVGDCLKTGWISSVGPYVERFEREFAAYVGSPHATAVASGTAALHLSLIVSDVRAGDLVIVPSVTFIAPVNAVTYVGARPVFLDVDARTQGLDPARVESFVTRECERRGESLVHRGTGRRVRAILPVHLYGNAVDMVEMRRIARDHGLALIEDAAEGISARLDGQHVGTFGEMGCFSFNGNKILTTGGGGMVVSADPARIQRARHLATQAKSDPIRYIHDEIGFNYRMTNVQAAIGVAQLERVEDYVATKRKHHATLSRRLAECGIHLIGAAPRCESNHWMGLLLLPSTHHEKFLAEMTARRIQVRPIWSLNHQLPMYTGDVKGELPVSEAFAASTMCIPCHQGMDDEAVDRLARGIEEFARSTGVESPRWPPETEGKNR